MTQPGGFIPASALAKRRVEPVPAGATPVGAASPSSRPPSAVWPAQREERERLFTPGEAAIHLSPRRAMEDGQTLWLEAPNPFVADWVKAHLLQIEQALRPHTALSIRVCIG